MRVGVAPSHARKAATPDTSIWTCRRTYGAVVAAGDEKLHRMFRSSAAAAAGLIFATSSVAQTSRPGDDGQLREIHGTPPQQTAQAETPTPGQGPVEATPAPPEKEVWKAPFGGTWTATMAIASDYTYRGISQNQGLLTYQPSLSYESAPLLASIPVTAYVGAWGSNVSFGMGDPTIAEIDLLAGLRFKTLKDKLTFDLGYIRYNYPGAPATLCYDFNEIGLIVAYDFGVVQLSGSVRHSPNFFASSGAGWYKWGQVAAPLSFIHLNDNVSFKFYGTLGNQYVERFQNYGIPTNNYWDWQIGVTASAWGIDFTVAYVDSNLPGNSTVTFTLSKTF